VPAAGAASSLGIDRQAGFAHSGAGRIEQLDLARSAGRFADQDEPVGRSPGQRLGANERAGAFAPAPLRSSRLSRRYALAAQTLRASAARAGPPDRRIVVARAPMTLEFIAGPVELDSMRPQYQPPLRSVAHFSPSSSPVQ
jgi:hypothetical protein